MSDKPYHWSAEETAELVRLVKAGLSSTAIAARMGRSMLAIKSKRLMLKRTEERPPPCSPSDLWLKHAAHASNRLAAAIGDRRDLSSPPVPRKRLSFEEQLAAVRNGAALVPTFIKPRLDPEFTLGGSVGEINL